jgi:hypothetical protein
MLLSNLPSFDSQITTLFPQETMARNARCWCKSGKKWKHCHRNRHLQLPDTQTGLMRQFGLQAKEGRCLHPNAPKECDARVIRAHTVQRNGSLSAISEDGHVLSGRDTAALKGTTQVDRDLARIGTSSASTFRGFCGRHDNDTFHLADSATHVNKQVAFLLSYRALAYEMLMKDHAIRTMEALRERIDRGKTFEQQAAIQVKFDYALQGFQAGLSEHCFFKTEYDALLENEWKHEFTAVELLFDEVLPIVSSGTFFPEFCFTGNELQTLSASIGSLSLLAFNVCVIGGQTRVVFGWHKDPNRANERFVTSLMDLPQNRLANSIIRFCFEISDNIFVRPSWWTALSINYREDLLLRLRQNTPGSHMSDGLVIGDTNYLDGLPAGKFNSL